MLNSERVNETQGIAGKSRDGGVTRVREKQRNQEVKITGQGISCFNQLVRKQTF